MATDEQIEAYEDAAYQEQYARIRKRYGATVAGAANYGWGVGGDDKGTSIATKVYLPTGARVLSTYVDLETGGIDHEWQDY